MVCFGLREAFDDDVFVELESAVEIDFIVREGDTITIWQVVTGKLDSPEVFNRELKTMKKQKNCFLRLKHL